MTKPKRPAQVYERKESYLPHEVLDFLPNPDVHSKGFNLKSIKKEYDGDLMKMGSQRYFTFAKSLHCEYCGIKGVTFHKERSLTKNGEKQSCGFHFNLYAIDKNGEEVLMTKDHVVARARGGRDSIKNYVTCCKTCNEEKGATDYDAFMLLKADLRSLNYKRYLAMQQAIGRMNRTPPAEIVFTDIKNPC